MRDAERIGYSKLLTGFMEAIASPKIRNTGVPGTSRRFTKPSVVCEYLGSMVFVDLNELQKKGVQRH
jgi:hypothetical protein